MPYFDVLCFLCCIIYRCHIYIECSLWYTYNKLSSWYFDRLIFYFVIYCYFVLFNIEVERLGFPRKQLCESHEYFDNGDYNDNLASMIWWQHFLRQQVLQPSLHHIRNFSVIHKCQLAHSNTKNLSIFLSFYKAWNVVEC